MLDNIETDYLSKSRGVRNLTSEILQAIDLGIRERKDGATPIPDKVIQV